MFLLQTTPLKIINKVRAKACSLCGNRVEPLAFFRNSEQHGANHKPKRNEPNCPFLHGLLCQGD